MLNPAIRKKLDSLRQLPTIPFVISEVLQAVDNTNLSASTLANLIERDQALTASVLTAANSPYYGFARRIATVDLAVVVMGLNAIREIVLSMLLRRLMININPAILDIESFWRYSVFCGAASRVIARKYGYRLAGEAFVAGLVHDIGILVLAQYFSKEYLKIRQVQQVRRFSLVDAEKIVLKSSHSDVGAWLAEKWNLPKQICDVILFHHTAYDDLPQNEKKSEGLEAEEQISRYSSLDNLKQPLTVVVSTSEWLAWNMGYKTWANETSSSKLCISQELIEQIKNHEVLDSSSAVELLKLEIIEEFEKALTINDLAKR
ncbi:MAG: HDOD domain-containing protein [Ignavibacteria bacterium]|jgi:HD-like signal output (HDOD) protein|nr:HDOD domain-containing protein [Ignavibacteria bacterium]